MGTQEERIGPLGHWLATGARQNHLPGGGVEGEGGESRLLPPPQRAQLKAAL